LCVEELVDVPYVGGLVVEIIAKTKEFNVAHVSHVLAYPS